MVTDIASWVKLIELLLIMGFVGLLACVIYLYARTVRDDKKKALLLKEAELKSKVDSMSIDDLIKLNNEGPK